MKTLILFFAAFIATKTSFAKDGKYEKTMKKTLAQYLEAETIDDFIELANKFMTIAAAEEKEWLPLYYHAHCYIIMSFIEKESPEKRDEYLDEAAQSIEKTAKLVADEPEIFIMQGMLYTARLMIDPMTRGQKFSALSAQAIGKALALEPNNPRAQYMQIANDIGTAQFFGNDIGDLCAKAQILYDKWDEYEIKSEIHPKWGKDQLESIIKQCAGQNDTNN